MRNRWVRRFLFVFAWIGIGLIFSYQLYLLSVLNHMKITWQNIIEWELTRWCLWMVFYRVILRTIRRAAQLRTRLQFVLANASASILFSLAHMALFSLVYWLILRVQDTAALHLPWTQALSRFPGVVRAAAFDPQRLFQSIFPMDFHIGILIYWVFVIGQQSIEHSRKAAELQTQLAQAQLQALKMQIHPHFLFNTLNSIAALIPKNPEAADDMIGELGNFLRMTLHADSDAEVTLEQELRFLTSYLEIEKIRFPNRLFVNLNIDASTLAARVPNLILQPLIENAIRHGIAQRSEAGHIEVGSKREDGGLHLKVQDDGPGLPETYNEGIGIRNVKQRLKMFYNSDCDFRIVNRPEGGVLVDFLIPLKS